MNPNAGGERPINRPFPEPVNENRPGNRPSLGQINRPNLPPTTPTTRPAIDQRPLQPGVQVGGQTIGGNVANQRPDRPVRPGLNTRPRPGQGGGGLLPNQTNNTVINNITNNNITNNTVTNNNVTNINVNQNNFNGVNIHNQQYNYYNGWVRPGGWSNRPWGWSTRPTRPIAWNTYWNQTYIAPQHQVWYHGAWGGHWATTWVAPFALGVLGWGSSQFIYSSGLVQYYNPYTTPVVLVQGVDYSRPIVLQQITPVTVEAPATPAAPTTRPAPVAAEDPGLTVLAAARDAFRQRDYQQARLFAEGAVQRRPGDPAAHEFYALTLFALQEYQAAATVLNALLAAAPGWDWTTMQRLYAAPSEYEPQLRSLENYTKAHPDDAPARFVLAYHYLVCGHGPQAINALKKVSELQPRDAIAGNLLRTLQAAELAQAEPALPEEERLAQAATGGAPFEPQTRPAPVEPGPAAPAQLQPVPQTRPAPVEEPAAKPAEGDPAANARPADPATDPAGEPGDEDDEEVFDFVGTWQAKLPAGGEVELRISEESGFVWTFHPEQGEPKSIEGQLNTDGNLMLLESPKEGTMAGVAEVLGGNSFRFRLEGAPPADEGLTFQKRGTPRGAAEPADGEPEGDPAPEAKSDKAKPEEAQPDAASDKPAEEKPAEEKPAPGASDPAPQPKPES